MNMRSIASAFAVAAAFCASDSQAVSLNPRGLGQVLIYPYYTVNKDQVTLLSVVNASDVGEVVKVRTLEGYNGRTTMDFVVFLSPHDVWTASLSQTSDDGGAKLMTADKSCTQPAIPAEGIALSSAAFDGSSGSPFPPDTGPTSITRTREGSIELFALGDIIPGSDLDMATKHVQNGTPDGGIPACTPNLLGANAVAFMSAPSNGLSGSVAIVDVGQGTFFGYNAAALSGFSDYAFVMDWFQVPSLRDANSQESSVPGGAVAYISTDSGRPLALDYANGIDAVSAVFTADAIYNDYLVEAQLGAQTDWVVTFPTKELYVDPFFVGSDGVMPPFVETFGASTPGQSNVHFNAKIYDREEGVYPQVSGVPTTLPPSLPYEVNVVSFAQPGTGGETSPVLGSHLVSAYLPPFGADGWARVDLASGDNGHQLRPDANDVVLSGLPVTGFMVYNIINANAQPGLLANYGGTFPHRSTVSCDGDTPCP